MSTFVTSTENIHRALTRLCEANDATVYENPGGISLMIRGIQDEDGAHSIDISVVASKETPYIDQCMRHEADVVVSEDGDFYIVHEYTVEDSTIGDIKQALNEAWLWTVCPCSQYLVKQPGERMCYICELTLEDITEDETDFCPICHDYGHPRWMHRTVCCNQRMHRTCYQRWKSTSDRCAICRST